MPFLRFLFHVFDRKDELLCVFLKMYSEDQFLKFK